jgi:hypothetical protein
MGSVGGAAFRHLCIFSCERFGSVMSSIFVEPSLLRVTESRRLVMPYLVRAEVEQPGRGTFRAEAETKRDAIEKASELRSHGLVVQITDSKGEAVDENK